MDSLILAALAGMTHSLILWWAVSALNAEGGRGIILRTAALAVLRLLVVLVGMGPAFAESARRGMLAFALFTACRWTVVVSVSRKLRDPSGPERA